MLPQAQRSSVDLGCRCVLETKLSEPHLACMAKMHTVDVQLKHLLVFSLTFGLNLVSLLCYFIQLFVREHGLKNRSL